MFYWCDKSNSWSKMVTLPSLKAIFHSNSSRRYWPQPQPSRITSHANHKVASESRMLKPSPHVLHAFKWLMTSWSTCSCFPTLTTLISLRRNSTEIRNQKATDEWEWGKNGWWDKTIALRYDTHNGKQRFYIIIMIYVNLHQVRHRMMSQLGSKTFTHIHSSDNCSSSIGGWFDRYRWLACNLLISQPGNHTV